MQNKDVTIMGCLYFCLKQYNTGDKNTQNSILQNIFVVIKNT